MIMTRIVDVLLWQHNLTLGVVIFSYSKTNIQNIILDLNMSRTLVIDNGSYTLKVGYSSPESVTPLVIPNSIARSRDKRTFVGSQLDDCRDYSGMVFRRPNEKVILF